eukprot:3319277-Rhodomonas_salina.3
MECGYRVKDAVNMSRSKSGGYATGTQLPIVLRFCYAMSGTATDTELSCYAMSDTDLDDHAMPQPVLS